MPDAVAVVNNLLCAYWQNTCETVDRDGGEERERGRGAEILGTWHSGERLEIQLSNLQDITGFPLECTLLPVGIQGAVQEEGGWGRGRYKNISLIYCGLNKLLGKAANRQTN